MIEKNLIILCPGQGSQFVGMGKDLTGDLFKRADDALEEEFSKLCFEGPAEELQLTKNAQPAIVAHSLALWDELLNEAASKGLQIRPSLFLGHSVGEYSALSMAGALSFNKAVKAVRFRGEAMQKAVPVGKGAMTAIMLIPPSVVEEACTLMAKNGYAVSTANFNSPKQTVISGSSEGNQAVVEYLKKEGHKVRAIPLKVSAPFHGPLMRPAELEMAKYFESLELSPLHTPYIANIDAKTYGTQTTADVIKSNLTKQVCGSVRWMQGLMTLPEDSLCLEVGPGTVLSKLGKQIRPDLRYESFGQKDDIQKTLEALS